MNKAESHLPDDLTSLLGKVIQEAQQARAHAEELRLAFEENVKRQGASNGARNGHKKPAG